MDLHVRVRGSGDAGTLLFLHGFPFDGSIWDPQMAHLPPGWRGLAPDLRGFGRSPLRAAELPSGRRLGRGVVLADEPVLTMDALAADAADLIERHAAGPAVVCGMSMGGYVAFALRRRRPELVRGLILMDTRPGPDGDEARENRRRTATTARESGAAAISTAMLPSLLSTRTRERKPEVADALRSIMEATAPRTLIAALAGMAARADSTSDLPEIGIPTLVIVGADDVITPLEQARHMAERIPGARLEVVDAAGHVPGLEDAAAVNRLISDFLATL